MDASKNGDDHMTSAAAFVEGGVQEACDDACSICLEDFSQSDPSTVTNCKHEFHLQCILEWCQRSSNCPMCWQSISLKDATSQELLEAVEQERILKHRSSRNATLFHHPTLGEFDLQHLPLGEVELEEHIFQHLAAAAAMRRGHYSLRTEGQRNRSSSQAHRPFFVFTAPSPSHSAAVSSSTSSVGETESAVVSLRSASMPYPISPDSPILPVSLSTEQSDDQHSVPRNQQRSLSGTRSFAHQTSPGDQDTAGPSDLQSLSESLRSRFSAWSTRYKESISRNTRGWKERLFARSPSMADIGSEVRREVNVGIANVSRMMEGLDSRGNSGDGHASGSADASRRSNMSDSENRISNSNMPVSCAASSASRLS